MTPIEALKAMLDEPMFGTQKERVVAALEYVPTLLAAEREAERARVVAWLKKRAWMLPKAERQSLLSAADTIARGEHEEGT